jgi:hypothetical protein
MQAQDVRRLSDLQAANAALKPIVADQVLAIDAKPEMPRRDGGALADAAGERFLVDRGPSQRRASPCMGISRRSLAMRPGAWGRRRAGVC